jgi:cytochrome b subunit of formate dehydrogenase
MKKYNPAQRMAKALRMNRRERLAHQSVFFALLMASIAGLALTIAFTTSNILYLIFSTAIVLNLYVFLSE